MRIEKNTIVALRYIMRNSMGEVLENKMDASPVNYLQGGDGILPVLQQQLEGLHAGNRRKVLLSKANGADDDFEFEVMIDDVRAALPEEIELGYPLTLITGICEDDCACYTP